MNSDVIKGYEIDADDLILQYESFSSADLFEPVLSYLPIRRSRLLDIGAGTGRDAAWFASTGHEVTAVEPVDAFRREGSVLHNRANISWIKDSLPKLTDVIELGQKFDVIILSAVWQHLEETDCRAALFTLKKLATDKCKVILSVRHGLGAPNRTIYPVNVSDTVKWADENGFEKLYETSVQSLQKHNRQAAVTWTWIVLLAGNPIDVERHPRL